MAAVVLACHPIGRAAALPLPWRPDPGPDHRPDAGLLALAHPAESQPQFAHPPESQPQFAHPPESQPRFAHPPESQPQFAHPLEPAHSRQSIPTPGLQSTFAGASDTATARRSSYRRASPPSYSRTYKPRQLRQEASTPGSLASLGSLGSLGSLPAGPRHAFFKSFYPEAAPTAAPTTTTAPTSVTTTTTPSPSHPDVHVVAMSVSTSVKKGGEEASTAPGDSADDSPGSASVIHPVLVPPAGGPVRFRPDWAPSPQRQQQTTQVLPRVYGVPEENYEVDEALSVLSNGRAHGKQPTRPAQPVEPAEPAPTPPLEPAAGAAALAEHSKAPADQPPASSAPQSAAPPAGKAEASAPPQPPAEQQQQQQHADGTTGTTKPSPSGYVVEGRNYRKYRVEEKTPDGFIVGEYGVVSHQDGSLRGVRYTADSTINPRLIYDALVKFLSL